MYSVEKRFSRYAQELYISSAVTESCGSQLEWLRRHWFKSYATDKEVLFSRNQIIYVEVCIYAGERKKSDSSPWIPDVCDTMTRKELSFHSYSVKMVYAPRLKGRLLVYCFVWTLAYARSKTKWQLKTHKWAHIFCYKYRLTVVYCRVSAAESTILTRHSKFKRA